MARNNLPRLALILGDPAGVGPELVARTLADPSTCQRADLVVISDDDEMSMAMADAGVEFTYRRERVPGTPMLIDNHAARPIPQFVRGEATAAGGEWVMSNFRVAFALAQRREVDAVLFAPLNKTSLHLANMNGRDEMEWFETVLADGTKASEVNILPELTTARVTSHVPLSDVAGLITFDRVVERGLLLADVLAGRGIAHPRIGVCALNPHAGDNGNFGREEIDTIAPAVAELSQRGLDVHGPVPADTIFVDALVKHRFDGVLTMFHDQGQIAMKLTGFDRGVTMAAGLSVPVCTPAHGTAFDIVGRGIADIGAYAHAFDVACRLAEQRMGSRPTSEPAG